MNNMKQYEPEIRAALRNIFIYVGGVDLKYVEYAQTQAYLENLLRRCGVKE